MLYPQVLQHNYSQPWPQNTDSYTSVHNYCINDDNKQTIENNQGTEIFQVCCVECLIFIYNSYCFCKFRSTCGFFPVQLSSKSVNDEEEPLCLKIHFTDTYTCQWRDCGLSFDSITSLVNHTTIHYANSTPGIYICMWKDCTRLERPFDTK